jgi:hypothetical protein
VLAVRKLRWFEDSDLVICYPHLGCTHDPVAGAGMQQIADWLSALGLSEYVQHFADNGIDFSVLPDLTDQDLKEIGIIHGHRRKILPAIAKIQAERGTPVVTVTPVAPTWTAPTDTAAASGDGHVLRFGRLDSAFRSHGP